MTYIEKILKENGPTLTSELISILSKDVNNKDAIRKRLSRLKSPVMKLKGFFSDNQTLFYLQEQYGKEEYYEGLIKAFRTSAKRYYSIIKAIEYHNGYIPEEQLASYTFSPVENLKGHKNISNIIDDLTLLHLLTKDEGNYSLQNCRVSISNNFRHHKGVELAKYVVLQQFNDWARKIGLISYNSTTFHSPFSKFQWGFVAPSYVSGIRKYNNQKSVIPSFVIADILIGKKIGIEEVEFFLKKVDAIKAQNVPNFIPFLLTDGYFSEEAFEKLKEKGIVVGLVEKLFGTEYQELLKALINTVTNAGAILKEQPQEYVKFIEKLNKLVDGKTNNLRGDLFEMAVGYYHSNICQSLEIGKRIMIPNGKRREIDVYAVRQTELRIAECKGYKYKINETIVKEWLTEKIPVIYDWIKSVTNNEKNIVFEFWSTGGFTDEALNLLNEMSSKTKKYKIEFYQENEIIEKAQDSKSQKIVDIMRDYFIHES